MNARRSRPSNEGPALPIHPLSRPGLLARTPAPERSALGPGASATPRHASATTQHASPTDRDASPTARIASPTEPEASAAAKRVSNHPISRRNRSAECSRKACVDSGAAEETSERAEEAISSVFFASGSVGEAILAVGEASGAGNEGLSVDGEGPREGDEPPGGVAVARGVTASLPVRIPTAAHAHPANTRAPPCTRPSSLHTSRSARGTR